MENSLASQRLGLSAFTAVVQVLIPGQGTVIPQAVWPQPKEKNNAAGRRWSLAFSNVLKMIHLNPGTNVILNGSEQ